MFVVILAAALRVACLDLYWVVFLQVFCFLRLCVSLLSGELFSSLLCVVVVVVLSIAIWSVNQVGNRTCSFLDVGDRSCVNGVHFV